MSMLLGLEDCCFVWRLVCVFPGLGTVPDNHSCDDRNGI